MNRSGRPSEVLPPLSYKLLGKRLWPRDTKSRRGAKKVTGLIDKAEAMASQAIKKFQTACSPADVERHKREGLMFAASNHELLRRGYPEAKIEKVSAKTALRVWNRLEYFTRNQSQ